MKNQPQKQELHTMPLGKKFSYYGKKYRMILSSTTRLKASMHNRKIDVMDLKTIKTVKMPYLTKVLRLSE
jgi:hypothetical protein